MLYTQARYKSQMLMAIEDLKTTKLPSFRSATCSEQAYMIKGESKGQM